MASATSTTLFQTVPLDDPAPNSDLGLFITTFRDNFSDNDLATPLISLIERSCLMRFSKSEKKKQWVMSIFLPAIQRVYWEDPIKVEAALALAKPLMIALLHTYLQEMPNLSFFSKIIYDSREGEIEEQSLLKTAAALFTIGEQALMDMNPMPILWIAFYLPTLNLDIPPSKMALAQSTIAAAALRRSLLSPYTTDDDTARCQAFINFTPAIMLALQSAHQGTPKFDSSCAIL